MNELITQVSQKTGLTTEQATAVVQTVIAFLKGKLPSPIAGQIDSLLSGGTTGLDAAKVNVTSAIGSVFGKK